MHAKHGKDSVSLKLPVHPEDRGAWLIHAGEKGPVSILHLQKPCKKKDKKDKKDKKGKKDKKDSKKTTETLDGKEVKEIEDILKEASRLTGDKEALEDEKEIEKADNETG